jgi:acyl-CoA reductase-like NAD-dependent aldehyde dehydrogenase
LDEVPRDSRIAVEEIFGPVIPIIPVDGEAEALQLNNASEYGLDACVFTRNIRHGLPPGAGHGRCFVTINAAPAHRA